ncbi:MAG: GMC family oxidoreductase [Sylvanvirus sp.]|uniref:GMC family oxidoreductase n=1 Tax=Sylvanvirus sp. TaxID=2487774 RepID=A0A3G5AIB7_9VIRU|nr:MAG: GMC family oxidoreductase [Sylvanvirus sp.]
MSEQKNNKCSASLKMKRLKADIIVIGGGGSGCVLLNKLSENGRFSVLGIEAGGNFTSDPTIQAVGLPALLLPATSAYKYYWSGFKQTEPQPMLNGRVGGDWTTGMMLGGGTSVNGLYYGRGSNAVYSRWQDVSGSDNWSLNNILTSFTSLENYQGLIVSDPSIPGARGTAGPVNILQTPTVSQLTLNVLLPASQAAFPGIPVALDYNDPTVENCLDVRTQWLINPTDTTRVSSATAFLNSEVMTPEGLGVQGHTLRVVFNCVVYKIVLDKQGCAKKVLFIQNGQLFKARAKKAIVLASGINSSKILQLSGIGPQDTLVNAGIKPFFINENVGKHLQNHPLMSITLLGNPSDNGIPTGAPYAFTIHNIYLPQIGGSANDPRMIQMLFEYVPVSPPLLIVGFELLNPTSEGQVNIQSANPFQIAAASDGVYSDPQDLENMKNVIKVYIRSLLEQLSLVDAFFYRPILSDPINQVIISGYNDDVVEAYVKDNTNLNADARHYTSHCKMAPLNAGGVVDGDTRVYGTKNLFIADNSICSVLPDINTTGAALMIGWRTSEILKTIFPKDTKCQDKSVYDICS